MYLLRVGKRLSFHDDVTGTLPTLPFASMFYLLDYGCAPLTDDMCVCVCLDPGLPKLPPPRGFVPTHHKPSTFQKLEGLFRYWRVFASSLPKNRVEGRALVQQGLDVLKYRLCIHLSSHCARFLFDALDSSTTVSLPQHRTSTRALQSSPPAAGAAADNQHPRGQDSPIPIHDTAARKTFRTKSRRCAQSTSRHNEHSRVLCTPHISETRFRWG